MLYRMLRRLRDMFGWRSVRGVTCVRHVSCVSRVTGVGGVTGVGRVRWLDSGGRLRQRRRRRGRLSLSMGSFHFSHQLVRLVLRHLSTADHILKEIPGALEDEPGETGG